MELMRLKVMTMEESRDRQKEMIHAIANQRDMYRTLLAQATPLPGNTSSPSRNYSSGGQAGGLDTTDFSQGVGGPEEEEEEGVRKALEEVQEQFSAYKKEKATNDSMLQQQLDTLREECSQLKIINAKLGSKVRI